MTILFSVIVYPRQSYLWVAPFGDEIIELPSQRKLFKIECYNNLHPTYIRVLRTSGNSLWLEGDGASFYFVDQAGSITVVRASADQQEPPPFTAPTAPLEPDFTLEELELAETVIGNLQDRKVS